MKLNVEVATRYLPSGRRALVGGDWYDSVALPGGRTLLVMGDVMGHGFQAAVAMSQYRSVLRTVAASGLPVDEMLGEADRRVARIGLDRVATCLLVLVDPENGTLYRVHGRPSATRRPPPGRHHRGPGPRRRTPSRHGARRLRDDNVFPGADAVLLLYTDGLVEQRGTDIDDAIRGVTDLSLPADGSLERLVDTLLTQLTSGICEDDIALLAARQRREEQEGEAEPPGRQSL